MEKKTLRMLWHGGFHDRPLNGLAEYNGEKVYFLLSRGFDWLNEEDYPPEVVEFISKHQKGIMEENRIHFIERIGDFSIYFHKYPYGRNLDLSSTSISLVSTEEYEVDPEDYYSVCEDVFYKIYRMPGSRRI